MANTDDLARPNKTHFGDEEQPKPAAVPHDLARLPLEVFTEAWIEVAKDWSGTGQRYDVDYDTLNPAYRAQLKKQSVLGRGNFGDVFMVRYRSLDLARKSIKIHGTIPDSQLQLLKTESAVGRKLDSHRHIIKLVGTYWKTQNHFNILTFPVAVCDLGHFLKVCQTRWVQGGSEAPEPLRKTAGSSGTGHGRTTTSQHTSQHNRTRKVSTAHRWEEFFAAGPINSHATWDTMGTPRAYIYTEIDQEYLTRKLNEDASKLFNSLCLEWADRKGSALDDKQWSDAANQRLREIMGCVTQGILWMHSQGIQHRDLKPPNILLRPRQVFLTDFGISRDRSEAEGSTTDYHAGHSYGYAAPEVVSQDWNNPRQADIYSLGCVFLHILTVLYNVDECCWSNYPPRKAGDNVHAYREEQFRWYTMYHKWTKHPLLPRHIIEFLVPMFEIDRKKRPSIEEVDENLKALQEDGFVYYGRCCLSTSTADEPSSTDAGEVEAATSPEKRKAVMSRLYNSKLSMWAHSHPGWFAFTAVMAVFTCLGVGVLAWYLSMIRSPKMPQFASNVNGTKTG